jgi:hypothetical protein
MRIVAIGGGVLLAVVLAAFVVYRVLLPRAFVVMGRGALAETGAVQVTRVATSSTAIDFSRKPVEAGAGHKYALIDCRFTVPSDKVDFHDFQLVKERSAKLGHEENVGDQADRSYFLWTFLDASSSPVSGVSGSSSPFHARLAFKVPDGATTGYLFYWGLYWGPLELTHP